MTSLLDLMHAPPVVRPVDPDGAVIQGEVDETLTWYGRRPWIRARIELHRHDDGLWMWAIDWRVSGRGAGYRVGPKWGRFAETRADALFWAVRELVGRLPEGDPDAARIRAWAESLA
jgi:hypothetical protein